MATTQLNLLSAAFSFLAAILWFVSAMVQLKHKDRVGADGWIEASIISDENDVIESSKLQQK
jgi:hypothetical protein